MPGAGAIGSNCGIYLKWFANRSSRRGSCLKDASNSNQVEKMKLTQRTCATCAAFNQTPKGDEPTCWNLVSITEQHGTPQALSRQPSLGDCCDHHRAKQSALIE